MRGNKGREGLGTVDTAIGEGVGGQVDDGHDLGWTCGEERLQRRGVG